MVFEKRELRVELARKDEDRVMLSVADTGVGIPAEVDPETADTLGMQIVSRLARQLKGSLRVSRGPQGTRLEIEFPLRPGGAPEQDDTREVL
jgi:two-component sensor histidine kinase